MTVCWECGAERLLFAQPRPWEEQYQNDIEPEQIRRAQMGIGRIRNCYHCLRSEIHDAMRGGRGSDNSQDNGTVFTDDHGMEIRSGMPPLAPWEWADDILEEMRNMGS